METKSKRLIPFRAVHPGEILNEELKERGIKQKVFASQIGMQASHLNEFIKGKRDMTTELAMSLERTLGISYDSWMSLHAGYLYDKRAIAERDAKIK